MDALDLILSSVSLSRTVYTTEDLRAELYELCDHAERDYSDPEAVCFVYTGCTPGADGDMDGVTADWRVCVQVTE